MTVSPSISPWVSPWVAPLLASLPGLLWLAVNGAITVTLLSYVIMPRLSQWFKGWLLA
jgi:antibiotic biosynthesis monooxygenase (ABM) superfamily enzyme